MLLSRIGLPSLTDWKTKSSGPSDLTTLSFRTARPAFTQTVSRAFVVTYLVKLPTSRLLPRNNFWLTRHPSGTGVQQKFGVAVRLLQPT
jgi:hypothetical protein